MALGPKSRVSSSESTSCTDSGYAPSAFKQRESASFPFFSPLHGVLRHPRILECLLSFMPYGDFNALTSSCSEFRKLMENPALKDTILSCFLPGFRTLLRFKNPELFVDVHVTIADLNTFREPSSLISPSVILMSYAQSSRIKWDCTHTRFTPSNLVLDLTMPTNSTFCTNCSVSQLPIQNSFSFSNPWHTAPSNLSNRN